MSRHSPIPTADGSVCGEDNEEWPCRAHVFKHGEDPEPQPSEGPDYHAEHAAWEARQHGRGVRDQTTELLRLDEAIEKYWRGAGPPSKWQCDMIIAALRGRNLIAFAGRQTGRTTVAQAIERMYADL